jgi:hypothetical protein
MTTLKIREKGRASILVDGFLPPIPRLRQLKRQLLESAFVPQYQLDEHEDCDTLFKSLSCILRQEYHNHKQK